MWTIRGGTPRWRRASGSLDLRPLGDNIFEGDSLPMPGGRVFGGQVLAQSVLAAGHTVDESRAVHSMHGYFLRPGDATRPIRFEVEELRDGRSFSARRTHAFQDEKPILSMIASFQVAQEGPSTRCACPRCRRRMPCRPGWTSSRRSRATPRRTSGSTRAPFDVRHVEGSIFVEPDKAPKQYQTAWMRVRARSTSAT